MTPIRLKKFVVALLLVGFTHIALGSSTGSSEKRYHDLYSLKYFNKNFYRICSPFSLRAGFEYKGSKIVTQKTGANGDLTLNTMLRFEKGNTTYIYPYTHKVVMPRFKTPTAPSLR